MNHRARVWASRLRRCAAGRHPSLAVAVAVAGTAVLSVAAPANAAVAANASERGAMARAAATSDAGQTSGMRVGRGGRVTMAPLGYRTTARLVAVRSSIARGWGLLVALPGGRVDQRLTFLMQRRGGRWRVRAAGRRGDEGAMICARRTPGTAVVLDLGLVASVFGGRCRHPRERLRLVRSMTRAEVASVRAMVEWRFSEDTFVYTPGPVQPAVADVQTSDCAWDGRGSLVPPPSGEVSRANRAWGAVTVTCVIGSDGFGALESPTTLLVARAGRSGPFTRVLAHTLPSWSARGGLCTEPRRRWRVPAPARVALEFCTPFPHVIRDALR